MSAVERRWRLAVRAAIRERIQDNPDLRRAQRRAQPARPWGAWVSLPVLAALVVFVVMTAVGRSGNEALAPLLLLLSALACGALVGAPVSDRFAAYMLLPLEPEQVWRREWLPVWRWTLGVLLVVVGIVLFPVLLRSGSWNGFLAAVIGIVGQVAIAFAVGLLLRAFLSVAVLGWSWLGIFLAIVSTYNADLDGPIRAVLVPWCDAFAAATPQGVFHEAVLGIAAGERAALPVAGGVLAITLLVLPGLIHLVRRRFLQAYADVMAFNWVIDEREDEEEADVPVESSGAREGPSETNLKAVVAATWNRVAARDARQELAATGWISRCVAMTVPRASAVALAVLAPETKGWTRRWQWSIVCLGVLWVGIACRVSGSIMIAGVVLTLLLAVPWFGGAWQGWERLAFPGVIPFAGLQPVTLRDQMRMYSQVVAVRLVIGMPVVGCALLSFYTDEPGHAVGLTALLLVLAVAIQPVFFALTVSQRGNGTVFTNLRGFLRILVFVILGVPLICAGILAVVLAATASWIGACLAVAAVLVLVPLTVGWWWRGYHTGAFDLLPYPR